MRKDLFPNFFSYYIFNMIIYFTNIPKCWCVIIDQIFSNAHANNDRTFNSWPKHLGWNCKLIEKWLPLTFSPYQTAYKGKFISGGCRTAVTSTVELFLIIFNGWKPLTYHKELHLGCWSSPRSASMRKSKRLISDISHIMDSSKLKGLPEIALYIKHLILPIVQHTVKHSFGKGFINWIKIISKNKKPFVIMMELLQKRRPNINLFP